jgi:hypothetical protein
MKKKIAVLFHENERKSKKQYVVNYFADIWKNEGHEVIFLFGIKKFVPADLIIFQVNLSVIPAGYREFAKQYPVVLNAEVKDILKSTFSKILLTVDSHYEGKVIVKPNLNCQGSHERRMLTHKSSRKSLIRRILPFFYPSVVSQVSDGNSPKGFRIYDHLHLVPPDYFKNPALVVEKFLPEVENGFYFIRICHFLGDRMTVTRLGAKYPIVKFHSSTRKDSLEPAPEIKELVKTMKFDYGNFEYVMHQGNIVLLDVNWCMGMRKFTLTPQTRIEYQYLAAGIYSYFKTPR